MPTLKDAYNSAYTPGDYYTGGDWYNQPYDPVATTPTTAAAPVTTAPSTQVIYPAGGMAPSSPQPYGPAASGVNYPFRTITPFRQVTTGASPAMRAPASRTVGQPRTPLAKVQMGRTSYEGEAPEFEAPDWDERELKSRTQAAAAVGLRQLRMALSQAMAKSYENPNVRRMVLRDALAGYGLGVAGVIGQARQTAAAEYGQQYAREYQASLYQYQQAWQRYQSTGTQVTTVVPVYDRAEYDQLLNSVGLPVTASAGGGSSSAGRTVVTRAQAALQKT